MKSKYNIHVYTHPVKMQIQPMTANLTKLPLINVTMNQIMNSKWVDLKTRAIFFDFSFYNPNLDIFLVARTVIEFLPSGIVNQYATFRTVDPFRYVCMYVCMYVSCLRVL